MEDGEPGESMEETVPVDQISSMPAEGIQPDKDADEQPDAEPSTTSEIPDNNA
jgi:hypothetical protein